MRTYVRVLRSVHIVHTIHVILLQCTYYTLVVLALFVSYLFWASAVFPPSPYPLFPHPVAGVLAKTFESAAYKEETGGQLVFQKPDSSQFFGRPACRLGLQHCSIATLLHFSIFATMQHCRVTGQFFYIPWGRPRGGQNPAGIQPASAWNPAGFQPESGWSPAGT